VKSLLSILKLAITRMKGTRA